MFTPNLVQLSGSLSIMCPPVNGRLTCHMQYDLLFCNLEIFRVWIWALIIARNLLS